MSKSSEYRQDLIVSIRYRNDLPPPPMPPKLLEIDTGGLQQYLDPGFAASIAKREEPNIEADAEGGMPIDVIGMYGYFDGDESSIMAPEIAPPLDPQDEALMLTPEQLKAGGITNTSNFLRKTQYMTSTSAPTQDPRAAQARQRRQSMPKQAPLARDDKENIKRNIRKAFDLAYPKSARSDSNALPVPQTERSAWDRPIHPEKKHLKPVGFYPILPDLDAVTSMASSWNLLRFDKPPLPAVKGHRDNRLDAALLMANQHPEKQKEWEARKAAYEADPDKYEDPGSAPMIWSLWLPQDQGSTPIIRKLFNSRDPEHDDEGLLARVEDPSNAQHRIPFDRTRVYTNVVTQDNAPGRHTRQVVIAVDPLSSTPAAHYYPIGQVNLLKSDRAKVGQARKPADSLNIEEILADQCLVLPEDPIPQLIANRYYGREEFDPAFEGAYKELLAAAGAANEAAQEADVDGGDVEMSEG